VEVLLSGALLIAGAGLCRLARLRPSYRSSSAPTGPRTSVPRR
jgi:hypothetical protein